MSDVNGTRFHLVMGLGDWKRFGVASGVKLETVFANALDPAVSWDDKRGELTLGTRVSVFTSAPANRPPKFEMRRGAAADRFGDIYAISDDRHAILVGDGMVFWSSAAGAQQRDGAPRGSFAPTDPAEAAQPLELRGVAVTNDGYLFAGVLDPKGVLLFDLQVGGPPRQFLWPVDVDFEPFDLAALPSGGVAILDRAHKRVWLLDRALGICAPSARTRPVPPKEPFQPIDPAAPRVAPSPSAVSIDDAIALDAQNPIAVEAMADGSILVLDTPDGAADSRVARYVDGALRGDSVETRLRAEDAHCRGFDCALVNGVLWVVPENGDQAFAFDVKVDDDGKLALKARPDFAPMRLFSGRAVVATADGPWYDSAGRWTPLVTRARGTYVESASVVLRALDGKQPDCVWHRLFLDACIPSDCAITVRTRAANEKEDLDVARWSDEPPLLRRAQGSELPWSWSAASGGVETWELLFQRARGRWLDVELTLRGTRRATPRVRAARVWYPRFSYLERYLPKVWRQDRESASFIDRFLALFEGFFTNIEDRIAAAQLLFDSEGAPPDALEWLASWFGIALDPAWDEAKRRLFLRHAAEFFEWRGTTSGLLAALRLALDDCADESVFAFGSAPPRTGVRIVERFRANAHRFSIVIPLQPGSSDAQRKMDLARRVAALEKPAHTSFDVSFHWTWFRIGEARLGEDTVVDLGSHSPFLLAPFEINRARIGGGYLAPDAARIDAGRIALGRGCARAYAPTPEAGDPR